MTSKSKVTTSAYVTYLSLRVVDESLQKFIATTDRVALIA